MRFDSKVLIINSGECMDAKRTRFYCTCLPARNCWGWISEELADYIIKKINYYGENSKLACNLIDYLNRL